MPTVPHPVQTVDTRNVFNFHSFDSITGTYNWREVEAVYREIMNPDEPQPSSDDVPSPGGSFVVYDNPHNVRDFSRPKKASGGAGSSSSWQETIGALNAALSHVAHTQFTLPSSAPPPQPHQHSSQAPAKKVAAVTGGLWDGSSPECCVALLAVMQCPLHAHTSGHGRFVQCAQAVLAAHRSAQLLMIDAWKHMPHDVLVARFLRPLKGVVEAAITSASEAYGRSLIAIPQDVMVCTQLLSIIYAASRSSASPLDKEAFYIPEINDRTVDFNVDWLNWQRRLDHRSGHNNLFSFCVYPYCLTNEAKRSLFQCEAQHKMLQSMQDVFARYGAVPAPLPQGKHRAAGGWTPPPQIQGFTPDCTMLVIRRESLLQDAIWEITRQRPLELLKPLRIVFAGEEGADAGGLKKEFFQLIMEQVFDPSYGMFVLNEETRTYWFSDNGLASEEEYAFVGTLMGLAIYNGITLDCHFPQTVYKKLLGGDTDFTDLADVVPELHRGLDQLLRYEGPGSVEDVFCSTFVVQTDFFGTQKSAELMPGGRDVVVTEANRQEYALLYSKFVLDDSVERPFRAFRGGFMQICYGPMLSLFDAQDLEVQICGDPSLDFAALEAATLYEGGFSKDTPVVKWFWSIVRDYSLENKKLLLSFVTGAHRAPLGGLGKMRFLIQRDGCSDKLPTSHTCFNALLLPEYKSRELLAKNLDIAIHNSKGFGLI